MSVTCQRHDNHCTCTITDNFGSIIYESPSFSICINSWNTVRIQSYIIYSSSFSWHHLTCLFTVNQRTRCRVLTHEVNKGAKKKRRHCATRASFQRLSNGETASPVIICPVCDCKAGAAFQNARTRHPLGLGAALRLFLCSGVN